MEVKTCLWVVAAHEGPLDGSPGAFPLAAAGTHLGCHVHHAHSAGNVIARAAAVAAAARLWLHQHLGGLEASLFPRPSGSQLSARPAHCRAVINRPAHAHSFPTQGLISQLPFGTLSALDRREGLGGEGGGGRRGVESFQDLSAACSKVKV